MMIRDSNFRVGDEKLKCVADAGRSVRRQDGRKIFACTICMRMSKGPSAHYRVYGALNAYICDACVVKNVYWNEWNGRECLDTYIIKGRWRACPTEKNM